MEKFEHVAYETLGLRGLVGLELYDAQGVLVEQRQLPNTITYDAGLAIARLVRDSRIPQANGNNGVTMLAVGTGALGANPNDPDRARPEQRRLNRELTRKPFAAVVNRDETGRAVARDTHVVDFITLFGPGEAVGPLNEMALVFPASPDPTITSPIVQKPLEYDRTLDVRGKDLLLNYFTFGVINKSLRGSLKITWRITF